MGCIPSKRARKVELELITNISPNAIRRLKDNIQKAILDPKKVDFACRKFVIPEPESKIFRLDVVKLYENSGGQSFGEIMFEVLKDFQNYTSSQSYFFGNIHHVCIQEFSIETGLSVLIIFCLSCGIEVNVSHRFPFIRFENGNSSFEDILRSWTEFAEILQKLYSMYKNAAFFKDLKIKTEYLTSKYKDSKDEKGRKKFKYFSQILEIFTDFIKELQETYEKVLLFCKVFPKNKKDYEDTASILKSSQIMKCENLVHLMF
jgi:hypothetical protein